MASDATAIRDIKQIMVESKMLMMTRHTGFSFEYLGLRPRFKMPRHPVTYAALLVVQSDNFGTAAETYLTNGRQSSMALLATRFIPSKMRLG